jgi:amino-acid N-acetyltransferase
MAVRAAQPDDLSAAETLMRPLIAQGELLPRNRQELLDLLANAFVVESEGRVVGFAALEIYSRKLSEVQCLSFEEGTDALEIAIRLVWQCVQRATERGVLEVMAMVSPPLDPILRACGFAYGLPNQKKALFIRPARASAAFDERALSARLGAVRVRRGSVDEAQAVGQFLTPFVERQELLPRTLDELRHLLRIAFLAEDQGRIVGFAAIEFYSEKLGEIQCISVDAAYRGRGIGRLLIALCVEQARAQRIAEVMAITARDEVLSACGFNACLADPKTALFFRTYAQ